MTDQPKVTGPAVRDLARDLFLGRMAQTQPGSPDLGDHIESVTAAGDDRLVVTIGGEPFTIAVSRPRLRESTNE